MVGESLSFDCKFDLLTIRGNLNGVRYMQEVLNPVLVPHFDNHPLASRSIFMDDNTCLFSHHLLHILSVESESQTMLKK